MAASYCMPRSDACRLPCSESRSHPPLKPAPHHNPSHTAGGHVDHRRPPLRQLRPCRRHRVQVGDRLPASWLLLGRPLACRVTSCPLLTADVARCPRPFACRSIEQQDGEEMVVVAEPKAKTVKGGWSLGELPCGAAAHMPFSLSAQVQRMIHLAPLAFSTDQHGLGHPPAPIPRRLLGAQHCQV
jgi:hypothetical protein